MDPGPSYGIYNLNTTNLHQCRTQTSSETNLEPSFKTALHVNLVWVVYYTIVTTSVSVNCLVLVTSH